MTDRDLYAFTADVVILSGSDVLLIDRKWEPLGYALPGGHVDPGERARDAAAREAAEEVHVEIDPSDLTHIRGEWDAPDRDPRRRTITYPYVIRFDQRPDVAADDDAAGAVWVPIQEVRSGRVKFAFPDHADIIAAGLGEL